MANTNPTTLSSDKKDDIISRLRQENATLKETHEARIKELKSLNQIQSNGYKSQFHRLVARERSSSVLKLENANLREENAELRAENLQLQMDLRIEAAKVVMCEARVTGLRVHIANQRRGEEHRVLETEHTIRVLQSDVRELVHFRDEEVEGLRKALDTMSLPPPYTTLNPDVTPSPAPTDTGTADATSTLSTASIAFRRESATGNGPAHVIRAFHDTVRCITLGVMSQTWPATSASSVLNTTLNIITRLGLYLRTTHPLTSPLQHLVKIALAAADTLVFETLLLLFASGGRKAELAGAVGVIDREADTRDDEAELRFWKLRLGDVGRRFEGLGLEWKVFEDSMRWVGDSIVGGMALAR